MTFLDLFSGIGGFRLGMEQAGHTCLGHCEIDKYANKSYEIMHNPKEDEWNEADIRKVRADGLPNADCWCFGFPCQDISVAGKGNGFRGNRSSLFFTVTRLIRDLKEENRPTYLFIENVKNLLSINRGFDFLKLLVELDEIGYDAEWDVLNTAEVLPQNRERVFIVGHFRGRGAGKVFPVAASNYSIIEKSLKVNVVGKINSSQDGVVVSTDGISPTHTSGHGNCPKIAIPVSSPDYANKSQNGRRFKKDGDPSFTLTTQDRHGILSNMRIRKLTPKECFRLQGFPDDYFERAESVNSDSQLYKQSGNSVTVPIIGSIAEKMEVKNN